MVNSSFTKIINCTLWFTAFVLLAGTAYGMGKAPQQLESEQLEPEQPNIIIILADDLGYGDVRAYNQASRIPTPNLDKLAAEGMRFTDAHTPSSVCTPTRYALLTGRYAWRTHLKEGALQGYDPMLIEEGRETIPSLLKKTGYDTAIIGKWHVGLGKERPDYHAASPYLVEDKSQLKPLSPGPTDVGFDYFFGIPASLDMPPYLYVENHQTYSVLKGQQITASKSIFSGGPGYWRAGEIAEGFVHEDVQPELTRRAVEYIRERGASKPKTPFFLYFPLSAPHHPVVPTEEYWGKTSVGGYGDFIAQLDDDLGKIRSALEEAGLADNTLVIYTSDNGARWDDRDKATFDHLANAHLRGQKADIHEAGHRVPFIAWWPGKIPAGSTSAFTTTLTDVMATISELVGVPLGSETGPDSFSILPTLQGKPDQQQLRPAVVHHSGRGMYAIREGDWKLVEGLGSGGFTKPRLVEPKPGELAVQLYNLKDDPAETKNLAAQHPDIVASLQQQLDRIRQQGTSRF